MIRACLAAVVLAAVPVSGTPFAAGRTGDRAVIPSGPPRARPPSRWPDAADLARLRFVEGKPGTVVLLVLGHPSRVEARPDGEEVWDYPWSAACRVWVRSGVCTGTSYTAGY
jgi:hypothetical protein